MNRNAEYRGVIDKIRFLWYNNYAVYSAFSDEMFVLGGRDMNCKKRLNKQNTGRKIYQAIERSGYTYEQVAEELGLQSPRVIYEWTAGRKLPTLVRLVDLAVFLGVSPEDLLAIE